MDFSFDYICAQLTTRALSASGLIVQSDGIRQAAVTIWLRNQCGMAELLVIKRAEHPGDPWSGHLALPGGRADAADADLLATAIRETHEEVGLRLDDASRILGSLPVLTPRNPRLPQVEITPLIITAPRDTTLLLNDEVATAFWMDVRELKTKGRLAEHRRRVSETEYKWPAYDSPHGPIWGITERILTGFLALLD
ncbi:MAG: NUDIX hydrolase [Blastocatellia bacterium]